MNGNLKLSELSARVTVEEVAIDQERHWKFGLLDPGFSTVKRLRWIANMDENGPQPFGEGKSQANRQAGAVFHVKKKHVGGISTKKKPQRKKTGKSADPRPPAQGLGQLRCPRCLRGGGRPIGPTPRSAPEKKNVLVRY